MIRRRHPASDEALVGKRVRVQRSHHRPELQGRVGTVRSRWGPPPHTALDVVFDDGEAMLFAEGELAAYEET